MNKGYVSFYDEPKKIRNALFSIDVSAGSNITSTITEAITLTRALDADIQFDFNGITVTVNQDSNPDLIYRDWNRALSGYIKNKVGPNPATVLTTDEILSDAKIEAKNERERQERHTESDRKATIKRNAIEGQLIGASGIELIDEIAWQESKNKNSDAYGGAVITYAERWARLMQIELAAGKTIEEIANSTSQDADLEGITGFMYGCAVALLSKCWKHGEQLRRWHNLKTQIGKEGEKANEKGTVLNPALLSIS